MIFEWYIWGALILFWKKQMKTDKYITEFQSTDMIVSHFYILFHSPVKFFPHQFPLLSFCDIITFEYPFFTFSSLVLWPCYIKSGLVTTNPSMLSCTRDNCLQADQVSPLCAFWEPICWSNKCHYHIWLCLWKNCQSFVNEIFIWYGVFWAFFVCI